MSNRHHSLAALLVILAWSCAKTDKVTQPAAPFGTFTLLTINGSLPAPGFTSSITLDVNGQFSYVETQGTTTTFVSSGQFSLVAQTSNLFFFDATQHVGNAAGPCAVNCQATFDGRTLLINPSPLPAGTGFADGWRYTSQ